MITTPWILVSIGVGLLVLLILWFFLAKRSGCGMDYYSLFLIGLIWLPAGLIIKMPALWILGALFLAVGLANKGKWRKRCMWVGSKRDKVVKFILLIVLLVLFAVGIIVYLLNRGVL